MILRPIADALLSALLAPPCAVCARILDRPLDGAVCASCWDAVACVARPFHTAGISRATAVGEYDGVLREIIHALKYQGRRSIAPPLASLMATYGAPVLAGADAVVPVPLHPRRERERGFNQADDLARGLGLPVRCLLRRVKSTQSQVELPAAERYENVRDAFEVIGMTCPAGLPFDSLRSLRPGKPRHYERTNEHRNERPGSGGALAPPQMVIVLVDDVTTTGATLEACARALAAAGIADVRALTAARVASP